ncbi:hypothetical protein AAY473_001114 [Plecturocebus cupreus]
MTEKRHLLSLDFLMIAILTDVRWYRNVVLIFFVFLVELGFHYVGQAGLDLLTSTDQPTSASQSAGIVGPENEAILGDKAEKPEKYQHKPRNLSIGALLTGYSSERVRAQFKASGNL